jgi:hypothetical protein
MRAVVARANPWSVPELSRSASSISGCSTGGCGTYAVGVSRSNSSSSSSRIASTSRKLIMPWAGTGDGGSTCTTDCVSMRNARCSPSTLKLWIQFPQWSTYDEARDAGLV